MMKWEKLLAETLHIIGMTLFYGVKYSLKIIFGLFKIGSVVVSTLFLFAILGSMD